LQVAADNQGGNNVKVFPMAAYAVMDTGSGFVIVSKENETANPVTLTKPQLNKQFLEQLAAGLNREPGSKSYQITLTILNKYERAI
jgi:hypothetical protein